MLVDAEGLADYAEAAVAALQDGTARDVVNWCTGDLLGYLNESGLSPVVLPLAPDGLAELVGLVARRELSRNQAKEVLDACREFALDIHIDNATFFLGRETLIATERPGMALWREKLFSYMTRNALRATAFFKIPPNQVFEVGAQVEL